jgi:lipid II:glycine glycyltransferase (peptidoglycan interpeptide bridge formation enzyme)
MEMACFHLNEVNVSKWTDLLLQSSQNPYQSYEWAKIHEETSEIRASFLWLKHADIEAGLLVLNKSFLHGIVSYSFSVGGPLCPSWSKESQQLVNEVLQRFMKLATLPRLKILLADFTVNSYLYDIPHIYRFPYYTQITSLGRSIDSTWRGLNKKARWSVRKAEKFLECRKANSEKDWESFMSIYNRRMKELGLKRQSPRFFRAIRENNSTAFFSRLYVAEREGEVVAGSLFIGTGRRMVYLMNASDPNLKGLNANDLLIWTAVCDAISEGISFLDLETTYPDPRATIHSIHQFKSKWSHLVRSDYFFSTWFGKLAFQLQLFSKHIHKVYEVVSQLNL